MISSEGSLQTWTTDFSLGWVGFGESDRLSKTTKLILLDSLLQEVCIKTDLTCYSPLSSLRVSVSLFSHKPSLFRTKESPLNLRKLKDIKTAVSTYLCSMMMRGAFL